MMGNDYYASPSNGSSTPQKRKNTAARTMTLILWFMVWFALGQAVVRSVPHLIDDLATKGLITAGLYTLFTMLLPAWFYARDMAGKGSFHGTVAYLGLHKPQLLRGRPYAFSLLLLIAATGGLLVVVNGLETLSQYIITNALGKIGEVLRAMSNRENATMELLLGENTSLMPLRLLVVALLPAFAEELFMRGALQPLFIDVFKRPYAGIIVTALLFSLLHASAQHFLGILAFALFFGCLAHYCKSLWPGIVLHFLNNSATIFLYQYTQSI